MNPNSDVQWLRSTSDQLLSRVNAANERAKMLHIEVERNYSELRLLHQNILSGERIKRDDDSR